MSLEREIGELTAKVENLEKQTADMSADIKQMRVFMEQARGSYKTVMGIAGASAAVGALAAKLFSLVPLR